MGWLFEDKGAAKAAQEEARQKLEKVELLNYIMQDLAATAKDESCGWMCSTKGYGDSLKRWFVVTKEHVYVIDCNESELVSKEKLSTKNGCYFEYTSYGYLPLNVDYRTPEGKVVNSNALLGIWAEIVFAAARKQFPELKFSETSRELSSDVFNGPAYGVSYTVPDYPWKSWF